MKWCHFQFNLILTIRRIDTVEQLTHVYTSSTKTTLIRCVSSIVSFHIWFFPSLAQIFCPKIFAKCIANCISGNLFFQYIFFILEFVSDHSNLSFAIKILSILLQDLIELTGDVFYPNLHFESDVVGFSKFA